MADRIKYNGPGLDADPEAVDEVVFDGLMHLEMLSTDHAYLPAVP